jgi:hypothetical protein
MEIESNDNQVKKEEEKEVDELLTLYDNRKSARLLRVSALCLLHSLTRSVQQLRTKFLDSRVWLPFINLIKRFHFNYSSSLLKFNNKEIINDNLMNIQHLLNKPTTKTNKKRVKSKVEEEEEEEEEDDEEEEEEEDDEESNRIAKISSSASMSAASTTESATEDNYNNKTIDDNINEHCDVFLNEIINDDSIDNNDRDLIDDMSFCNESSFINLLCAISSNLLLHFSPSKETMLENDIIKILVDFINIPNKSIKINVMWSLMNAAFQADQLLKQKILSTITMETIFQLLTEQDELLIMKTLTLIRNILYSRHHIDYLMSIYGTKIIQAIIMILESEYYNNSIKDRALCILVNISDGSTSKEFIMNNEDLIRKINSFMVRSSIIQFIYSLI